MSTPYLTILEACDVVLAHMEFQFSNKFASLYYGDILVYPPNVFRNTNNQWAPIAAVYPVYNRKIEGQETMASQARRYGIDILCMVNYTPYIEVPPEEAMGERLLNETVEDVLQYFTRPENIHFEKRVQYAGVEDVNWAWNPLLDQPIRGAVLTYEIIVNVPRV